MIIRLLLDPSLDSEFVVHKLACFLSVHGGETAVFIKVVLEQGRGFAHLWVGQNSRADPRSDPRFWRGDDRCVGG